jgi:hypothetical protein
LARKSQPGYQLEVASLNLSISHGDRIHRNS